MTCRRVLSSTPLLVRGSETGGGDKLAKNNRGAAGSGDLCAVCTKAIIYIEEQRVGVLIHTKTDTNY
jgi:hypothetical protein